MWLASLNGREMTCPILLQVGKVTASGWCLSCYVSRPRLLSLVMFHPRTACVTPRPHPSHIDRSLIQDIKQHCFIMDYDEYISKLDAVGESILKWADPEHQFRGYTEVSDQCLRLRRFSQNGWTGMAVHGLSHCIQHCTCILAVCLFR